MNLTEGALKRLKEQRDADYYKPWKPGVQMTDAELLWDYIENLRNQVSLARDEAFLKSNYYAATGEPYYSEEERQRGEQGLFG